MYLEPLAALAPFFPYLYNTTSEVNINVGVMQIGRDTVGGNAVMILTVDHEIPEDVLEKLVALDNVHNAVKIKL